MTTIVAWRSKKNKFVSMASDAQVTQGNIALPIDYDKIERVGDRVIIGGCGSVGNLQNVLARAKTNVIFQKLSITGGDFFPIGVSELSKELADLNFTLPLEHKHWNGFSYIVAGRDGDEENRIYSVSDDGAKLEVETFWVDGSGSQLAMSLLEEHYNDDLTKEEVNPLLAQIITAVSKKDIFTGWKPNVWTVTDEGITKGTMVMDNGVRIKKDKPKMPKKAIKKAPEKK